MNWRIMIDDWKKYGLRVALNNLVLFIAIKLTGIRKAKLKYQK